MNIIMLASECVPFAKTGGLADVVGALPQALRALGHEVIVVMPRYASIDNNKYDLRPFLSPLGVWMGNAEEWCAVYTTTNDGIPVYFIRKRLAGSAAIPGGAESAETPFSAPTPARPVEPVPALPLDKPPIRVALSTVLVWRGDTGGDAAYAESLARALAPYRSNDFGEAAARLAALAARHPAPEVFFYLRVSDLFLGLPADAVRALEQSRTRARDRIDVETAWYLAVAYERAGRRADARRELSSACAANGDHSAAACATLPSF